jgi:hypothetical protein
MTTFVARHPGTRSHCRGVAESFLCGEVDGEVLLVSLGRSARHATKKWPHENVISCLASQFVDQIQHVAKRLVANAA